ncbi:unnamed protein product [Rotaria magnacalcarata]|uniref:Uncharacterized protein n=1 Tax=Rotaria magnacalcarata TaxID=392030 RepID=A0A820DQ69_9BILA|nr:unnamed protein product [Rotaria magnacalcarata]CAF2210428.1 unnamed protein product [Rotaria magnacalcarata]CAF4135904.1 unnamed protein product [Rotaria magnacalcarata]CAF4235536.1 unnamed protein product [Rotaria magnacalcarata]
MRLTSGFFANLTNIKLHENDDAFKINIPSHWTWFFLRSQQLFLFFQDATHVATKWRNRLLASTAHLVLGQQPITMQHLQNIIDNGYNKLDHGLVYTDLNPKDKQNYTSCEKIASEDVLNILKHNRDTQATYVYLRLLKRIIIAYVERSTNIKDRLHSAWTVVFTCRLWKLWIKHNIFTRSNSTKKDETKKSKDKYFLTIPVYYSIEINAHNLLYLTLLVKQRQLPPNALNIVLFSSQPCESMFRNSRALSGAFSTRVNFTVNDFLQRAEKLSVLEQIKCYEETNNDSRLLFPIHHKHKKNNDSTTYQSISDIDKLNIENVVLSAYKTAEELVENLNIFHLLKQHNIYQLNDVSKHVYDDLRSTCRINDHSMFDSNDEVEFNSEDHLLFHNDSIEDTDVNILDDDSDNGLFTTKTTFSGMRLFGPVSDDLMNSYFKINLNNDVKYIHKQTASWLLTEKNNHLSVDRLNRVMEMNRQT